jgi:SPOR domain
VATYTKRFCSGFALLLGLGACSHAPNPVRAAMAQHDSLPGERPAVAFRFVEQRGGDARLYVLPGLKEATWRFHVSGLAVQRVIGFSRDADDIYLLTADGDLVGLDLGTGRSRVIDSTVVAAALGPTGTLHFVRKDGTVGAVDYRNVTIWPAKLDSAPAWSWGGASERFVALEPGTKTRELVTLSPNAPAVRQRVPPGTVSVSPGGDLAVVAVDSGVVVLDPVDARVEKFRRLKGQPDAVAFSPSEYEIYAALPSGTILVLDRYSRSLDDVARIALPGRARAMRVDPLGRILLVRPAAGDSTWLVDLATHDVLGAVPGSWRGDLPAVAPDGTVLTVDGADVVSYSADSLTVEGHVAGGAHDRWLTAAWDPRRPALQLAAESSAAVTPGAAGEESYVQVSSTSNQAWAESSAHDLRAAGLQASVLPPTAGEDFYRVVLGPYPTREAAEAIGRKLGRPFWIYTR